MPDGPSIETNEQDWEELRQGIMDWWRAQEFSFPWREEEGEGWRHLVTEILLQRTRATAVRELYDDFFRKYSDPEALAEATEDEIREEIHSLGLLWRAKYISQLGDALAEEGGEVPEERSDIEELPGVGQYAAGSFLTFSRRKRVTFIDANIVKLLGRYFGFEWDGETRRKRWFRDLAATFFDHDYEPADFGYAVLDFTREICGRSPKCVDCSVQAYCAYGQAELQEQPD